MGSAQLDAFYDELVKLAEEPDPKRRALRYGLGAAALGLGGYGAYRAIPGVLHGLRTGAQATGRGLRGGASLRRLMGRGWESMRGASRASISSGEGGLAEAWGRAQKGGKSEQWMKRHGHLVREAPGGNLALRPGVRMSEAVKQGPKGVAEELSRRGWTGQGMDMPGGGVTKYLPVGMKSLTLGFPLAALPKELRKGDPEVTGQGRAERVGRSAGETAGFVAGWPVGLAGGGWAGKRLHQAAQSRIARQGGGRLARYLARGTKGGLVPMLAASAITSGVGGLVGRAAGRPIDMATGEYQQARARKGLKDYLEHRQKALKRQEGAY